MTSAKIQNAANLATILAAIIAAGTFYYGYHQFKQTQQDTRQLLNLEKETLAQERQSRAFDLFIKYNELMEEPRPTARSVQAETEFWRENRALSIAESIFILQKNDPGWKATVVWMLSNHIRHLKKNGLNCPTYDTDFVNLANQETKEDLCKPR